MASATALSFAEVGSRGWFVCRVPFWFCVLRGLVVSCWLGVFVQRSSFSRARNVHLLELTVLPRLAAVLPLWEAWYYRATARYYRSGAVLPPSGTTAMTRGTTAPVRVRGDKDGQGEF